MTQCEFGDSQTISPIHGSLPFSATECEFLGSCEFLIFSLFLNSFSCFHISCDCWAVKTWCLAKEYWTVSKQFFKSAILLPLQQVLNFVQTSVGFWCENCMTFCMKKLTWTYKQMYRRFPKTIFFFHWAWKTALTSLRLPFIASVAKDSWVTLSSVLWSVHTLLQCETNSRKNFRSHFHFRQKSASARLTASQLAVLSNSRISCVKIQQMVDKNGRFRCKAG